MRVTCRIPSVGEPIWSRLVGRWAACLRGLRRLRVEAAFQQVEQSFKRGIEDLRLADCWCALKRNSRFVEGRISAHIRSNPDGRLKVFNL